MRKIFKEKVDELDMILDTEKSNSRIKKKRNKDRDELLIDFDGMKFIET